MRIYISGPMRGIPQLNHPAFERAACALRGHGHEVFSPHEKDAMDGLDVAGMDGTEDLAEHGFSLRDALADELVWVCRYAEGVVVLPGWRDSRGAKAEVTAALALGIPVWPVAEFLAAGERAPQVRRVTLGVTIR